MKFRYLLAVLFPLLGGCDTLAGLGAVDVASADDASCRGYGFTSGTEAYAACRLQLDLARKEENRDNQRELRTGLLSMQQGTRRQQAQAVATPRTCMLSGFRAAC